MEKLETRPLLAEDLSAIRTHAGARWQDLFNALGIERDQRKSKDGDWWARSPLVSAGRDKTPSFHMEAGGRWYCFSRQVGGGPIELVREVFGLANSYEAGRKLIELGFDPDGPPSPSSPPEKTKSHSGEKEKKPPKKPRKPENHPVCQDLAPLLDASHPSLQERGISQDMARQHGAGYLDPDTSRSKLAGRLVLQVRGFQERDGKLERTVLGHIGRATTQEQTEESGKYLTYKGFKKSLELYGQDALVLEPDTMAEVLSTGRIILVEGAFDLLKLRQTGILNVAASLGSVLSTEQIARLRAITDILEIDTPEILVWYDRDCAGQDGQQQALSTLHEAGFEASGFDWSQTFSNSMRQNIGFPEGVQDPCDFTCDQLQWLKSQSII